MSWFSSLFVKQKPKQKAWSVQQIKIHRLTCATCNKPFNDGEIVWVSPSGYATQHTDCELTRAVPYGWGNEKGQLKE